MDHENKKIVFDLLKNLQKLGKTIVVVTHDEEMIAVADRTIMIS
ncbi:hypothetical protein [Massilicoli timonensis]